MADAVGIGETEKKKLTVFLFLLRFTLFLQVLLRKSALWRRETPMSQPLQVP
jgi:hypothetical protein